MAISKAAQDIEKELAAYQERQSVRQTEAWRPLKGDTIKGVVTGLRMGGQNSEYGTYPVIIYKVLVGTGETKADDVIAVHAFHTLLRDQLAVLKTDIGSVQWVSYQGQRITNKTKDKPEAEQVRYHLYDVENDGEQSAAKEEGFKF